MSELRTKKTQPKSRLRDTGYVIWFVLFALLEVMIIPLSGLFSLLGFLALSKTDVGQRDAKKSHPFRAGNSPYLKG